nr:MAG TPA: hypothetical protein [Caudoviricetes sp.]
MGGLVSYADRCGVLVRRVLHGLPWFWRSLPCCP